MKRALLPGRVALRVGRLPLVERGLPVPYRERDAATT